MLPKFPVFKKLELSDSKEIKNITSKFEPYSDFDFASMLSWDVNNDFRVSQLDGNLIVRLTDHFSGKPFFSFLGNNDVNKTLKLMFAFLIIEESAHPEIRLVPEVSLKDIDLSKYIIEIDLNNYDYIYDLEEHISYSGNKFASKRKLYNKFQKNYPEKSVEILDISNNNVSEKIIELTQKWSKNKAMPDEGLNYKRELSAIKRFIEFNYNECICIALKVKDQIVGYDLLTIPNNDYAISHFSKSDISFTGSYEFLVSSTASVLTKKSIKFLNAEEDLGLPSLRYSKNSYRPATFLRKYTIIER